MAVIKVSEVAKKHNMNVNDVVKILQNAGLKVSKGDDSCLEEKANSALKGNDSDRRKAMVEQKKQGKVMHSKEVLIGKDGSATEKLGNKQIDKGSLREKLMQRKMDLATQKKNNEKEEESKITEEIATAPVQNTTEKPANVEETKAQTVNNNKSEESKSKNVESQKDNTEFKGNKNNTANSNKNDNRNKDSRNDFKGNKSENRDNRNSDRNGNRKDDRRDGNRDSKFGDKNKDRNSNQRDFNKDGNRDRSGNDKKFSNDKEGFGDKFKGQGKGSKPQGQSQFKGKDVGNDNVFIDDERKRVLKKKEDETNKDKDKEKENKKSKNKKDGKKGKSWIKTINEGMDELSIESEVESAPTISPNIDISDLIDVDVDRNRNNNHNKNKNNKKNHRKQEKAPVKAFVRPESVEIGEYIVISEFGSLIGVKTTELIKKLFSMGIMANVNQSIDAESAQLLGIEYGVDVKVKTITEDDLLPEIEDKEEDLVRRPPIVTVMGHVDHGKTSLLDAIRSTSVATGEAGGITQHIGAYEVETANGTVTFLDTPGHEAFTTLRARGALLTDIVILVVAADDGVKPQTKEAIDHAQAAGVKIVVAINKIDKDGANPDRVKQQLAEHGIISEDWGGEYQFQEISAKKRLHIDDLLDRVLLEAEMLDLKGNPNRKAEGVVIESRLDKQKGPVATVLVKNGTLNKGDTFISGSQFGKVRAMFNYKGSSIKEAGLSFPCEVMGFSELPDAGEKFIVTDEKTAKAVVELRAKIAKEKRLGERSQLTLADFFSKVKDGELKELNIVLKADAQGSLEALSASLLKLSNKEVKVKIIHDGIGAINESDVQLAVASNAIIIGFNIRPDAKAKQAAEQEKIDIELYSVIYQAIDDVKLALEGLLSPEMKENVIGKVEIRQIFSAPKIGKIAGCFVLEGKVNRNSNVRVIRDSIVIFDGKLSSLKRFTDDVKEVQQGYECGLTIDKYQDIKDNDILEVYEVIEEKRTLEDVNKADKEKESNK